MKMADAVFTAAIELLTTTGVYCPDTGKSIQIDNEEVLQAIGTPNALEIGRFKEKLNIVRRDVMDSQPPAIIGGPIGGKVSEKNYLNIHTSSAIEPIVQGIYGGSLQSFNGKTINYGTPEEMFASLEETRLERLATKVAGREGLSLIGPSTPTISQAYMLVSSDELYTKNDVHRTYQLENLKTGFETFYKAIFHQEHGNNYLSEQCPVLGDKNIETAEALAIIDVAETIQSRLVTGANLHVSGAVSIDTNSSSSKEIIWASNLSSMAISRNMNHSTAR